jgi:hypothetical protein
VNHERIGTVIHGALGDCYEQLCAIGEMKRADPSKRWIGFFAVPNRLSAMTHLDMNMLDEVYPASAIEQVEVDRFYQFQINDIELRNEVIDRLPTGVRTKFDFTTNIKPWTFIRSHDFRESGLALSLSQQGQSYVPLCMEKNGLDQELFRQKFTVGYLWRHRPKGGFITARGQRPKEWILQTKSELFRKLIEQHNAHIIIAGMNKNKEAVGSIPESVKQMGAFVQGEYLAKYTESELDIPEKSTTYLKGLGYAAEMEIMSRCDLLLMMPSGFSEALWMRRTVPVILMDPPPAYMARLWYHRMPLFDNYLPSYAFFNTFVPHTAGNVLAFLRRKKLLPALR